MKISELIEELSKCDPNSDVILQRDPEGNGYSPLEGVDSEAYFVASEAECYNGSWSASDACMTEEEWRNFKQETPKVVVLFPTY